MTSSPPVGPRWAFNAPLVIAIIVLALVIAVATWCSGCGVSAIQGQTAAIEVAVGVLDSASDVVEAAHQHDLDECTDVACIADVRDRWAPAAVAEASVMVALEAWTAALDLAMAAGGRGIVYRAIARAIRNLGERWNELATVLRPLGTNLPELPELVLHAADIAAPPLAPP